jgi:hypothetical protein
MNTQIQTRIDQNRAHTKALLMRRLVQSHRDHKDVAAKRIAHRLALRRLIHTLVGLPTLAVLCWLAMDLLGLEVVRAQSGGINQQFESTKVVKQVSAVPPPIQGESRVAGEVYATPMSEAATLKFDYELGNPAQRTNTP